jgi:hypothetical protein
LVESKPDGRGGSSFARSVDNGHKSYVGLETRIPANHPLRAIRVLVDEALAGLSGDFNRVYSDNGRPSIPPERLLRGTCQRL